MVNELGLPYIGSAAEVIAWSFEMRVAAYAVMVLAFGASQAAAQCYGPECDGRSGPPRSSYYYSDPSPGPGAGFERPPARAPEPSFDGYRGEPDNRMRREYRSEDMPPPRREEMAPPPRPAYKPAEVRPQAPQERTVRAPEPRRDIWGDRVPPPSQHALPRESQRRIVTEKRGPVAGTVTISLAEYEDLRNQARELQRLMGERRDFHDGPPRHGSGPGPGPSTIYR